MSTQKIIKPVKEPKAPKEPKEPKIPKRVPKTLAEQAGLPSDNDRAKEIAKVIAKESGLNIKVVPPRKKREITEEQREALRERLVKARAVRSEKRLERNVAIAA